MPMAMFFIWLAFFLGFTLFGCLVAIIVTKCARYLAKEDKNKEE